MAMLMLITEFVAEFLFFTVCGWIGHAVAKLVTFGKIDLDCGASSESVLAEWLGFFFVLFTAGFAALLWRN